MKVTTGAGFQLRVDRDFQINEPPRTKKSESPKKLPPLIASDLIHPDMTEMMSKMASLLDNFRQVNQFVDSMHRIRRWVKPVSRSRSLTAPQRSIHTLFSITQIVLLQPQASIYFRFLHDRQVKI